MVFQNYCLMMTPGFVKKAIDELQGDNHKEVIFTQVAYGLCFTILACLSMFLMRKYIISASRWIEYEIRKNLFVHLMKLDYRFYQENQTGDLISRCTHDLNDVRTLLGPGIMYIPNTISRIAFFLPVMLGISVELVLYETAIVVVILFLLLVLMPRLRPLYRAIQEQLAAINSRAWQVISGITTIRLYGSESHEQRRFSTLNAEYIRRNMSVAKIRGFLWPFLIYIFSMSQFFILLFGGKAVIDEKMTLGELVNFLILVSELTFPVLSFGWVMSLIQQGISAMERLNKVFDHPLEAVGKQVRFDAAVPVFALKNVQVAYEETRGFLLDLKELKILRGSLTGITGPVGGGKSTLINLLAGIVKQKAGSLKFQGQPLEEIKRSQLYQKLSLVPQEAFLFSKTISQNIGLSELNSIQQPRVRDASKKASLDREIERFRNGYEEIVGERGITLSGGQKQRATLARAFYAEAEVLLLDDSFSAVDAEVENRILDFLKKHRGKKTIVIASNRISALKLTERILVLDEGKIIQEGSHKALLSQAGTYKNLAQLQQMEMSLEKII